MDLLAHLEAYVAVAEEASFSRAADRLYVAQPVLSRRIKTLEQRLGGELFDRSRRQITNTDFGVLLLPYAKDVLSRVDRLRKVATAARTSAPQTLGVPPDSDPTALARAIRAGAQRGVTIRVQELSAEQRASLLSDGSLAFALLRVPPETATHQVPLGLASAVAMSSSSGSRPMHLESLRPRRGAGNVSSPAILLTSEDQVGFAAERFDKAIARAGLPPARVRRVAATATAVAETLAGHAVLLCTKPFARRHDLAWTPLADSALHRGYEFAVASRVSNREDSVLDWLEPLVADAIGAVGRPSDKPAAAGSGSNAPAPQIRSTAR
ncbi:LysR family transcriptional regulator [Micromonospora avicenniae]|uniref:DNA-binding transcriptional regulator, LysR family n=1 Tax=Micromonospora avicenniae TaxID=1198245 RepID=A0A1N7EMM1_9ACTN|nr:LysR family transcriptional regulator [Micromonospora avicenniae]SIR89310.1 DNA-binding transcriptional regulator, LysR family [Micromonospora avicenniae]